MTSMNARVHLPAPPRRFPVRVPRRQWNSALAVNYPARAFGVKRGDSFDALREKSRGKCVAIHLPVSLVDGSATPSPAEGASPREEPSAERTRGDERAMPWRDGEPSSPSKGDAPTAYDEEFNQPAEVRRELYRLEKNRMRSPSGEENDARRVMDENASTT